MMSEHFNTLQSALNYKVWYTAPISPLNATTFSRISGTISCASVSIVSRVYSRSNA